MVFCPQGLGQVAEQCGLGFAKTIFWGKGFGKTSTDLDFASGGGGVWGGILRLLLFLFWRNSGGLKKQITTFVGLVVALLFLKLLVQDIFGL